MRRAQLRSKAPASSSEQENELKRALNSNLNENIITINLCKPSSFGYAPRRSDHAHQHAPCEHGLRRTRLAHGVCKVQRPTAARDRADVYPGLLNSVLGAVRSVPAISTSSQRSHLPPSLPEEEL